MAASSVFQHLAYANRLPGFIRKAEQVGSIGQLTSGASERVSIYLSALDNLSYQVEQLEAGAQQRTGRERGSEYQF